MNEDEIVKQILNINRRFMKLGLMGPFYTKYSIYNAIKENNILFVEENRKILAFMIFNSMKRYNRINIKKLAVMEECQNRGIASGLFKKIVKVARDTGKKEIQARVSKINKKSHQWYINRGFKIDVSSEKKNTILFVYSL